MLYLYLLILLSGAIMGFSSLVEKKALIEEHATAFSASFSIITALLSLIFLPFTSMKVSAIDLGLIYLVSLISTITYILTARVYKHSNISIASPLFSSVPQLLIVIFAFVFLSEKLTLVRYFSIAVIILSVYIIMFRTKSKKSAFKSLKYVYIMFVDLVLMAASAILMKYTLFSVPPFTYLIIAEFFIAANMLAYISIRYGGPKEVVNNISKFWAPIFLVSGLTIIYRATYYFALVNTFVSIASPLRNGVEVLIAVSGGGFMFGEKSIGIKLIFSAIIIIAIYFLVV
ncbi:MAG: EamA family transporter [Candidatus Micrarchaeaceae archaeon]